MATRCSRSSAAHTARLYPYSYSPGTRIARRYWPKPPQTRGLQTATPGSIPGSPAQQEPHRMGPFRLPEPFSDRTAAAPNVPHGSAGIRLRSQVSIPSTIPRERRVAPRRRPEARAGARAPILDRGTIAKPPGCSARGPFTPCSGKTETAELACHRRPAPRAQGKPCAGSRLRGRCRCDTPSRARIKLMR
jgi:hypothetical protein